MRAFRQILGDRVAGLGAFAIVAQLLLIQALVTSFTCGTMSTATAATDGMATGGGFVLCHGGSAEATAGAPTSPHRGSSGGVCLDCPCGVPCAAGHAVFAAVAPGTDLGPAYARVARAVGDRPVGAESVPAPPPPGLRPDPTGPPSPFV